jgi:hypothetical protein
MILHKILLELFSETRCSVIDKCCVFLTSHPLLVSVGATIFRKTYQCIQTLLLQCHEYKILDFNNHSDVLVFVKWLLLWRTRINQVKRAAVTNFLSGETGTLLPICAHCSRYKLTANTRYIIIYTYKKRIRFIRNQVSRLIIWPCIII